MARRPSFQSMPVSFRAPLASPPTDGELLHAWADTSTPVIREMAARRTARGKPIPRHIFEVRQRVLRLREGALNLYDGER